MSRLALFFIVASNKHLSGFHNLHLTSDFVHYHERHLIHSWLDMHCERHVQQCEIQTARKRTGLKCKVRGKVGLISLIK